MLPKSVFINLIEKFPHIKKEFNKTSDYRINQALLVLAQHKEKVENEKKIKAKLKNFTVDKLFDNKNAQK